jgi:alkylation response protein AidB-like acyl-CoA dehydrogenase
MDFAPDDQQEQVLASLRKLLERQADRDRALRLTAEGAYDHELDAALADAGFMYMVEAAGPLDAALVGFEVVQKPSMSSYLARALVAPMVLGAAAPGPVALAQAPANQPVRFGQHARLLLALRGDEALVLETGPEDWSVVDNNRSGFPLARLKDGALARATTLPAGSGETLRNWWRVELAIQCAALIGQAVEHTVGFLRERRQFGRPIGSFQAVQHRLARLAVTAQGARWLALEAAHHRARPDMAATAAAFATGACDQVFRECHQLHGAIGFTREFPLHLWTVRLLQLQRELGGPTAHRRAAADLVFRHPETLRRSVAPAV